MEPEKLLGETEIHHERSASSAFRRHWPVELSGVIDLNLPTNKTMIRRCHCHPLPSVPGLRLLCFRHLQANLATCLLRLLQALCAQSGRARVTEPRLDERQVVQDGRRIGSRELG